MDILKVEGGYVEYNRHADDMHSSSEQRRGLKRRMVEDVAEAGQIIGDAVADIATTDDNNGSDGSGENHTSTDKQSAMGITEAEEKIMYLPMTSSDDLPEGMFLEWNPDMTQATLTIASEVSRKQSGESIVLNDRELRICLVGRARIRVVEGSAEVLGHTLQAPDNNDKSTDGDNEDSEKNEDEDENSNNISDDGVVVTSPYWSSWMTIEADSRSLPCKIVMDCVRGSESFKVTAPKRPIILTSSWRTCVDSITEDFCTDQALLDPSSRLRRRTTSLMIDSMNDYEETNSCTSSLKHHDPDYTRRVCMITGAKGVGKSTLLRYLTNRILSTSSSRSRDIGRNDDRKDDRNDVCGIDEVAILDTDVGQPELAPPGLLRLSIVRKPLLQPPYWNLVGKLTMDDEVGDHNEEQMVPCYGPQQENDDDSEVENDESDIEVVSSVFFGASTSKADPSRYIDAIQFLMKKYETCIVHSNSRPVPLLINMDGWIKGLGYQILSALIDTLRPTHLVQIVGEKPGQMFDLPATVSGSSTMDNEGEAPIDQQTTSATIGTVRDHCLPKVYKLEACQTLSKASLCRIPAYTTRNFRWATYFLPDELQTFDAWDFVSAKSLQTGWIVSTNSDRTTTVPRWWHNKPIIAIDDNNNGTETTTEIDDEDEDDEDLKENDLCDDCRLARALARERPFCVPMEALEAFIIGSDFEDHLGLSSTIDGIDDKKKPDMIDRTHHQIFRALNGCVVALCTNTQTKESLGYGILRSIDWEQRLLYVLVAPSVFVGAKDPSSLLSKVKALVGGSLPLPLAMLFRGIHSECFPYLNAQVPTPIL
eukprot:CAMPEP_0197181458 /NCGR_PEP_ID=MMETSP1423-20130617/5734_1 /TAXON_ID=476441 /ORGANISM="Pseudo-nitzschia heimii, Strain UNC1101" /LENGTH=819 /DNA_ID=CAMNT_0042631709 /DNA_START=159 /DNA_END=2619 /DNA_ORIENTATION=-